MGSLRNWWKRFDAFGRRFMIRANPILGHREEEILATLEAKKVSEVESKSD